MSYCNISRFLNECRRGCSFYRHFISTGDFFFNFNAFDTYAKFFDLSTFRNFGRLVNFPMWNIDLNYSQCFLWSVSVCTNLQYLKVVCKIFAVAFVYSLDTSLFKVISKRLVAWIFALLYKFWNAPDAF